MTIIHCSDTHLGFQAFDHVTAEGINAREQDIYDAFERVVARILEIKPNVVIHSGDFFHRPSPSNRALTFGLEQLKRLCDAKIPIVVIAGNHETPKTIYNSPILRALRNLDCVYPIFGESWEKFEFDGTVVHGVPHINDNRILYQELERPSRSRASSTSSCCTPLWAKNSSWKSTASKCFRRNLKPNSLIFNTSRSAIGTIFKK